MNYFRCDTVLSVGHSATLSGATARHVRDSRRMKVADEIVVQDPTPRRFVAVIKRLDTRTITIEPVKEVAAPSAPPHSTTLLQSFISEQNIDLILQKTTELGVHTIVLFPAEHSPYVPKAERLDHKFARWQNITYPSST